MQQDLRQNNAINIAGKIVSEYTFSHEVYGEGFYTFDVEVPRLSDVTDTLPITISERLIDKEVMKINSFVNINGQIRSYNNYHDQKNRLILTIFTRDIEVIDEISKNPNQVILNGYICKTPVYRTTPFGREIADILLAVNRSYNKSDYIPCIAWGRNAKFAKTLEVGNNIRLWGRMQSRTYQKKLETGDVLNKIAFEVSISKMENVIIEKNED